MISNRVKQAIVKKEETVSQLKQQHAAAVKRADHLESLLEQQRKQLIKKWSNKAQHTNQGMFEHANQGMFDSTRNAQHANQGMFNSTRNAQMDHDAK